MTKFAWLLSMAVGFLSLSQEILWVRIISFHTHGMSQAFALVLFFFLVGIALGSAAGKRLCERQGDLLRTSAIVLAAAAVLDLAIVAALPRVTQHLGLSVLVLIVLTAALKSVMFPIAHHLGSQQSGPRIGRSVSKVYFGNIVGSTLGPIVTGYVLLDVMSLGNCLLLVGLCTALLSLACAARARTTAIGLAALAATAVLGWVAWPAAGRIVDAMALANKDVPAGARIQHLVENRHGIVHTLSSPDGKPDTVMGGNMYDGLVSVDMDRNDNRLDRALVLLAVHPKPERVLLVGLSAGAWARVLSASPRIKELVVVEINPGYLELIARYPQVAGLLRDPRIRIVIDDGRRWMRRNPGEKFDLIVQNTTFSWRAYQTNLLSREYMALARSHLKPGGIVALNSTWSGDVLKTAHAVFPFVERRFNFVYGSEKDFSRAFAGAESAYRELRLDDAPVFPASAFGKEGLVRNMVASPFVPRADQYADLSPAPGLITDQNLLVEHAHGRLGSRFPGVYRAVNAARLTMHTH